MRMFLNRAGESLRRLFELTWHFLGSMAAVCLFAAVLGLGIYHAVVHDSSPQYRYYAGLHNPAGAEPPSGIISMGNEASPGVPHVRLEYLADGRLKSVKYVDSQGRLCPLPGSRVAEQRLSYNAESRLTRKENRAAGGALAEDAQGVAVREFAYDSAGRLVSTRFRNAAGQLSMPRFPGYAECRTRYDAAGNPLVVEYLDAGGKPVVNAAGEQRVEYEYRDDGNTVIRRNVVDGKIVDNYSGIAQEEYREFPNGTSRSWSNAAGEPVEHPDWGAASLHCDTHLAKGLKRRRLLGADGAPCKGTEPCTEHLQRSNLAGMPEWECFGGEDGMPVNHPARGYAERVCEYAPTGELEREYFWDCNGRPARVTERRLTTTPLGRYSLSLQRDGSTTVQPE